MNCTRRYVGILLALLAWTSCKDLSTDSNGGYAGAYDAMIIDRQGGGDLGFTVLPSENSGSYSAVVSHWDFREALIVISIEEDDIDRSSYTALASALDGEYEIEGDFEETTLPTGTWVRVFMVHDGVRHEVTNVGLRGLLLKFEEFVREIVQLDRDPSPDPATDGRYQYASYDTAGTLVVHGWFTMDLADPDLVTGEWHFMPVGDPQNIGPQTGDGRLVGGFRDSTLWIELQPQFRDNNLGLAGTLRGNNYAGTWMWITFAGPTSRGTFNSVKR